MTSRVSNTTSSMYSRLPCFHLTFAVQIWDANTGLVTQASLPVAEAQLAGAALGAYLLFAGVSLFFCVCSCCNVGGVDATNQNLNTVNVLLPDYASTVASSATPLSKVRLHGAGVTVQGAAVFLGPDATMDVLTPCPLGSQINATGLNCIARFAAFLCPHHANLAAGKLLHAVAGRLVHRLLIQLIASGVDRW